MSFRNIARFRALDGFVAKSRLSALLAVGVPLAFAAWDEPSTPNERHSTIVAARFPVGVQTELAVDAARAFGTGVSRIMQITVWYPARGGTAARVTYADYVELAAAEMAIATDSARANARAAFASFFLTRGLSEAVINNWLQRPMLAVRDASPLGGRYPLIIIVHGNGQSAVDQSTLAEHLAESGYVVATTPSYTRISRPPASEADLGAGAEEQADDIAFVVARVAQRSDVDTARLGVVAHSLGARGALFYAMRTPAVRALVSLDGGIGTATGRVAMEQSPSFASRRIAASILHFSQTADAFMAPDFGLLRELSGAQILVARTSALHHHHFTSLGAWCGKIPGLQKATGADAASPAVYAAVTDLTRAYLNGWLKGDLRGFAVARAAASNPTVGRPAIEFAALNDRAQ